MKWILTALAFALLSACSGQWINSPVVSSEAKIRNNEDNRAITAVILELTEAIEANELTRIQDMVSRDYYENGGTTDTTDDDYGQATLMDVLALTQEHVRDMRVEVLIREIVVEEDRADVLMEFGWTMLYEVNEESRWATERDVNRVQLQREEGQWLIVSGL